MTDQEDTRTWPDEELYIPHRPTDGMMQARKERRRLMIGAGLVVALVAICWLSPARANIDWTIKDENGNWIDNPDCVQPECGPELPPPTVGVDVPHRDMTPLHGEKEKHSGFECYFAPWGAWVYHTAARFDMTPEHDAAAKGEALARFDRLGAAVAMTKVCRQWQINAGFKIAKVL